MDRLSPEIFVEIIVHVIALDDPAALDAFLGAVAGAEAAYYEWPRAVTGAVDARIAALAAAIDAARLQPPRLPGAPDRKSTRLNSSHKDTSRMPSSA